MTRYHVINRLDGRKFGDYGVRSAADERAKVLNDHHDRSVLVPLIDAKPVYEVRRVETDHIPSASGQLNG